MVRTLDSVRFDLEPELREIWKDVEGRREQLREAMLSRFLGDMDEGFGTTAMYGGNPITIDASKYDDATRTLLIGWGQRNAELNGRNRAPGSMGAYFAHGYREFRAELGLPISPVDFQVTGGLRSSIGARTRLNKRSMTISIVTNFTNHPHDDRPIELIIEGHRAKYGEDMFTIDRAAAFGLFEAGMNGLPIDPK